MNTPGLLKAADLAFAGGDNRKGLLLLRKINAGGEASPGTCHRQAVVEEQIGDWALAGKAHYQCIELAPHIATGYLYAGCWLEQSERTDAAAAAYSLAQEADPASLVGSASADNDDPTQLRAIAGNHLLRSYLSDQQRNLFIDQPDAVRIQDAAWIQTHDAPITFTQKLFAPDLFYIPDLPEKPFYQADEFGWAETIMQQSASIKSELENALNHQAGTASLRPYLSKDADYGALQSLAGSLQWSALDLFKDGQGNKEVATLFPQTLGQLKSIPTYALDECPVEVFFSLLKPKQQIDAHYGQSNHSLTVHLALEVPENCYLKVADLKREWQEGGLLIFNDSYLHSAHNQSERMRIVLIFSVWHPALTHAEQRAVQTSFRARRQWMTERTAKLDQLLNN